MCQGSYISEDRTLAASIQITPNSAALHQHYGFDRHVGRDAGDKDATGGSVRTRIASQAAFCSSSLARTGSRKRASGYLVPILASSRLRVCMCLGMLDWNLFPMLIAFWVHACKAHPVSRGKNAFPHVIPMC